MRNVHHEQLVQKVDCVNPSLAEVANVQTTHIALRRYYWDMSGQSLMNQTLMRVHLLGRFHANLIQPTTECPHD